MPGSPRTTPNADELADAVFDVEPQAAERLHQLIGVEALFGPRAQIAEDARAERATGPGSGTAFRDRSRSRAWRAVARRAENVRSSTNVYQSSLSDAALLEPQGALATIRDRTGLADSIGRLLRARRFPL